MPAMRKAVKRTQPRVNVDEAEKSKTRASKSDPRHRGGGLVIPLEDGQLFVSYTASELVPVASYANVTIGPVQVARLVSDPEIEDADEWADAVAELVSTTVGAAVQQIIARDRALVEESVRLHEEREAAEEAARGKKR